MAMSSCACEALNLGGDEIEQLDACLRRIVELGADAAVVRARSGEVIALAERDPTAWPPASSTRISRRLGLVDMGVISQRSLDLSAIANEAQAIGTIVGAAYAARWSW